MIASMRIDPERAMLPRLRPKQIRSSTAVIRTEIHELRDLTQSNISFRRSEIIECKGNPADIRPHPGEHPRKLAPARAQQRPGLKTAPRSPSPFSGAPQAARFLRVEPRQSLRA